MNSSPENQIPSPGHAGLAKPAVRPGNGVIVLERAVLGMTLGIITGFALFVATLWLVMKGGDTVGPHLQLLDQFFPGYAVTVRGSFVGMVYGFGCGFVSGWIIATVYNWVVAWRHR
jgi:hypothetical protein